MIAIKLRGGLGNQMFQYAYGRSLALKKKEVLLLDVSLLKNSLWRLITDVSNRKYSLGEFNIQPELTFRKEKKSLNGYWQNEKYFKNIRKIIINDFTLKRKSSDFNKLEKKFLSCQSVGIHFRRGDYASKARTRNYHGLLELEYYQKAVDLISQSISRPVFFIFSDDIPWVKENFEINYPMFFIEKSHKLTDAEEIILMSKCRHNIIANSSFSWWGAWLNQNPSKIIIAPKKWFNKKNIDYSNLIPQDWIKLW